MKPTQPKRRVHISSETMAEITDDKEQHCHFGPESPMTLARFTLMMPAAFRSNAEAPLVDQFEHLRSTCGMALAEIDENTRAVNDQLRRIPPCDPWRSADQHALTARRRFPELQRKGIASARPHRLPPRRQRTAGSPQSSPAYYRRLGFNTPSACRIRDPKRG